MTADDFFDHSGEELSSLVEKCEEAYEKGQLDQMHYSESEFEYLLDYFMEDMDDEILFMLSHMAYSQHPYSLDLLIRYCEVMIVQMHHDTALAILHEKQALYPSDKDILFLIARGYIKKENPESALEYLELAVALAPDEEMEMTLTAAQDFIDVAHFSNAFALLKKVEMSSPDNQDVINDIAFCLEREGKLDESLHYYQKYLDKDPFNENVWFNVGTIFARELLLDKAHEAFDFALALNRNFASALYNKAILLTGEEKFEEGISLFKEFLEIEPDNLFALIGIAEAYFIKNEPLKALDYYRMAKFYDYHNPDANIAIAYISILGGDYDEAIEHLRSMSSPDYSDFSMISDELAAAFKETGNPEFLIYYIMSLYFLKKRDLFYIYLDILLEQDKIWLTKLYGILPALSHDDKITKHIKEKTTDK
jgi:tetratricopeptide (TPR) repeat protein